MLHYTDHAKDRMRERGISEDEVEHCLSNYEVSRPSKEDDCIMIYISHTSDGRRIQVFVNEKRPTHQVVVSVME